MRYLVTGAAGFIGFSVAARLLARGDSVVGIDSINDYYDPELKQARIRHLSEHYGERWSFIKVDFSDFAALSDALASEKFDGIIHLGAQAGVRYSIENPHVYMQSNIVGHLNMLEIARHRTIPMVYASSSSVYGGNGTYPSRVEDRVDRPISLYAATKRSDELMSETYAHLYRVPLTGLRFFTVYGPWGRPDMAMWLFTDAILAGRPIKLFNHGDMYRDFTFVDDIVTGIVACADNPPPDDGTEKAGGSTTPHRLYNIGNNRPERLMDMIGLIEEGLSRKATFEMYDMQPGDVPKSFADIDAIQRDLGYNPTTPISVGVPKFIDWYRDYHRL